VAADDLVRQALELEAAGDESGAREKLLAAAKLYRSASQYAADGADPYRRRRT